MKKNEANAFREIACIYNNLNYASSEWADAGKEQLLEQARENRARVKKIENMENILSALYADKYGAVPELPEDELISLRGLDQASQCVRNEMAKPFVLNPPAGLFARKPKKEDYFAFGRSIQLLKYYYQITAVRQEAFAESFFYEVPVKLELCQSAITDAVENSPAYSHKYKTYTRPNGHEDAVYFGDVLRYFEKPEYMNPQLEGVIGETLRRACVVKGDMLHIPCNYRAGNPFVLFINHVYSIDHPEERQRSKNLLHNLIYQVIHAMPAYSYQFVYMDPLSAGSTLGELQGLTAVRDGNAYWLNQALYNNLYIMFDLVTNKDDYNKKLSELTERVGKVNTIKGATASVSEYNAKMFNADGAWADDAQIIPQQFVIIDNIHGLLSYESCQKLETLIGNAKKCGITVIMLSCRDRMTDMDEFEKKLMRIKGVDVIDWSPEGISISSSNALIGEEENGTFRYRFAPFDGPFQYPDYISSMEQELKPNLNVNTLFSDLFDIDKVWGTRDATNEIRVPVGVNDRGQITEISFGGSSVNGLLAGTIGCGKSSFLHTIINGVLMYYPPQEVELWLSDYKTVEFQRYMENTPANITYVGIARTKEYSLALIDKIYNEYERRALLFGESHATSMEEYRKTNGKDSMPRLLVIIDEFHVMSNHIKDEPDYSMKLGAILREARATGIGMLLSDQTCGVGLNGLKEDARLQLNCRMAMRTSIDEYNAVFNINNAAQVIPKVLNYEIVLRRETVKPNVNGVPVVNVFYEHSKTIYTPPEIRDIIAKKSIESYGTNEDLVSITSDLRAPADWDAILKESEQNALRRGFGLFPGVPKDLKAFIRIRMLDGYNENLISIGADDILQAEVMVHLVESICHSGLQPRIVFIASGNDDTFITAENWIYEFCDSHDFAELILDEENICKCIAELYDEMVNRRHHKSITEHIFIVWLGMPDLCRDMEHYKEGRPAALIKEGEGERSANSAGAKGLEEMFDSLFGTSEAGSAGAVDDEESEEDVLLYNATDEIRELLDEGPRRGIHSLVFNSAVSVSRRIKCAKFEYFNHKIAFRMSRDEAMDFLGNSRAIMTPENEIIDEETGVYYDGKSAVRFVPFINNMIEQ